jgi:hypothetical protein
MSLPANTKHGNMKAVMKNRKIRYKIDMGLYMRIFLPPPSSNIKIARFSCRLCASANLSLIEAPPLPYGEYVEGI